jgi:hypothetical protein
MLVIASYREDILPKLKPTRPKQIHPGIAFVSNQTARVSNRQHIYGFTSSIAPRILSLFYTVYPFASAAPLAAAELSLTN